MFIPDVINTLLMGLIFMVIVVTVVRPFVMHIVNGQMTTDDMQKDCLLYTSPSPRDRTRSRMPSSA